MKKFDIKKVIEWLGVILKCPICGFKYNVNQTKVIDSEESELTEEAHILIHSDCSKCKSSVIFNIDIHGPEVLSAAMVTDLTGNDSSKFKNQNPISTNEVIGIHKALKRFNGDFIANLGKK